MQLRRKTRRVAEPILGGRRVELMRLDQCLHVLGINGDGQARKGKLRSFKNWMRDSTQGQLWDWYEQAKIQHRKMLIETHPDKGGKTEQASYYNSVWDRARELFKRMGIAATIILFLTAGAPPLPVPVPPATMHYKFKVAQQRRAGTPRSSTQQGRNKAMVKPVTMSMITRTQPGLPTQPVLTALWNAQTDAAGYRLSLSLDDGTLWQSIDCKTNTSVTMKVPGGFNYSAQLVAYDVWGYARNLHYSYSGGEVTNIFVPIPPNTIQILRTGNQVRIAAQTPSAGRIQASQDLKTWITVATTVGGVPALYQEPTTNNWTYYRTAMP